MKILSVLIAVALAACSPAASPVVAEASADAQPAPTGAKPSAPTPANAPAAASISADALVGRWGDNGDCAKDIVFASDGTFRSYTGGQGRWSLNGDRIVMAGSGGTFELRIQSLNATQLLIGNPDGSIGLSQRC